MSSIDLLRFDNSWYERGRPPIVAILWFFIGSPILKCQILPSSLLRRIVLRMFGATVASNVVLKPGIRVKYPWRLSIGANSWIGEDCWIDNLERVVVGSNACVSQGAYLCTGNHDWSDPAFGLFVRPIVIGDGAWIAAKSLIGPGVVIGDGSVLTAGSVAMKNVPAFEIHGGNPARFMRQRILTKLDENFSAGALDNAYSASSS